MPNACNGKFGAALGEAFAVGRAGEVKYRKPTATDLRAYGEPDASTREHLVEKIARCGRNSAVILIDLKDRNGSLAFHVRFVWFISRLPPTPA